MLQNFFTLMALMAPFVGLGQIKQQRVLRLMGTRFEITVVAANAEMADGFIDLAIEEISRIEKMISSWDENSQTSAINQNAGINPLQIDQELFDLIQRSTGISKLTDGAFDISYASMDKIWKYDGSMTGLPSVDDIKSAVSKVGYKNIILDEEDHTVFLKLPGMKIGFGAIGKGYAADKAEELLRHHGVSAGIINASGDLNAWGEQPDGSPWLVGITNPLNSGKVFAWFPLADQAVATSGDYEKYVELEGKRYSHIIDPRTGYPSHGIISVSIFAPKAELADALATAVFIMGVDVGLDFINQLQGIDCIIIDDAGRIYRSENIEANYQKGWQE